MKRFVFVMCIAALFSCDSNRVFEEYHDIANFQWQSTDTASFKVNIENPEQERYNLYVNLRHADFYQWQNLWVWVYTELPDGKVLKKRVNLPVAEADGKWLGECMGDICDVQVPIQQSAIFPEKGQYRFRIFQDMRVDPVPSVMAVGFRIEKQPKTDS